MPDNDLFKTISRKELTEKINDVVSEYGIEPDCELVNAIVDEVADFFEVIFED